MTSALADYSRREELLNARRHALSVGGVALAALLLVLGGFLGGVWFANRGESPEPAHTAQALEDLADSLQVVRRVADSVHRADSLAMAAVLAQRPKTRAALAGIRQRGDTLTVERPTAARPDSVITIVVPELAAAFTQVQLQLAADSAALAGSEVIVLRHQVNLLVRRDSLHVVREQELAHDRDRAWRKGFVAGVKVVTVTAAAVGGAIKIIKVIAR